MTRPLVILTDITDLDPRPAELILAEAGFSTQRLDLVHNPEVPPEARDAVAAIVGYAPITEHTLSQLPQLKVLATSSVGTDMIDGRAARRHGVSIRNLAGVASEEVAVHALTLMLHSLRGVGSATTLVRHGGWTTDFPLVPPRLSELTLGVVGLGRIGSHLASIAQPLFGSVIGFDPFLTETTTATVVTDLSTFREAADVISVHLPLTDDTRGLIDQAFLAEMKVGALLVNVSRGELIDDKALHCALASGHLSGYAADVLHGEPPRADDPLRLEAIVTPHVAYLSQATLREYQTLPALTIIKELGAS